MSWEQQCFEAAFESDPVKHRVAWILPTQSQIVFPLREPAYASNLQPFVVSYAPHALILQRITQGIPWPADVQTLPEYRGQMGLFLPWIPLPLVEVWWSSWVMPVLSCMPAVTPPVTAGAMGKTNRDHCPVSDLCCLWTDEANAIKRMSLNSLLDRIQAVWPIPLVPAVSLGLGVSRHPSGTSVRVLLGEHDFIAPAACLHGKE